MWENTTWEDIALLARTHTPKAEWDSTQRLIALLIISNQKLNKAQFNRSTAFAEASLLIAITAFGLTIIFNQDSLIATIMGGLFVTTAGIGLIAIELKYTKRIIRRRMRENYSALWRLYYRKRQDEQ